MTRLGKDRQLVSHIIYCTCMRFKEDTALDYLSKQGHPISARTYYRIKKEIEQSTHERLNLIASEEFLSQHLERLDTLRTIHDELIEQYKIEDNPTKKANILMQLAELQTHLASFYDSTQYVMQQAVRLKNRKKRKANQQSDSNDIEEMIST